MGELPPSTLLIAVEASAPLPRSGTGADRSAAGIQPRLKPKKVGTAAVPSSRQAGRPRRALHRADEGGATAVWRAGTRPSSTSVRPGCCMDRPARLYLCARCRDQVVLCSHCDRGNRYCSTTCSRQARDAAQREAARRYQRSRRGRMNHAARTRRWRGRRQCPARGGANNVTHQGSQLRVGAAPLAAWTHDTTSSGMDAAGAASTPQDVSAPTAPWRCRRCATPQGIWVRQGFLRHAARVAMPAGRRHDRGP